MARMMLSLARIPQPRIGSFRFHDDGTITLTNRPLTCSIMRLENDGTPRTIQRDDTYLCVEPFLSDLSAFHDERFLSHPNAVYDERSCRGEMAARVLVRALAHHYIEREHRNGPFLLQLTDLHASNIFVDDQWNVTCLIDLEWICALPVEKLAVPYWLTGRAIDEIRGEDLARFNEIHEEYMGVVEEEEGNMAAAGHLSLAHVIRRTWESEAVWFWYSMTSINAMYPLITDHVCPRFSPALLSGGEELLSRFWAEDSATVVENKVAAYRQYVEDLERLFKSNT